MSIESEINRRLEERAEMQRASKKAGDLKRAIEEECSRKTDETVRRLEVARILEDAKSYYEKEDNKNRRFEIRDSGSDGSDGVRHIGIKLEWDHGDSHGYKRIALSFQTGHLEGIGVQDTILHIIQGDTLGGGGNASKMTPEDLEGMLAEVMTNHDNWHSHTYHYDPNSSRPY